MENKIKKSLLVFLLFILFAPCLEQSINFINSAPVYGAFTPAPDAAFSFENWWDDSFQDGKNKYLNDNIGFRPDFIRINNQLDYSVFGKLHFYYGILGKQRCIWDGAYIDAYFGSDYIGYSKSLEILEKLKKVQDTLSRLGISFILIQAPNKAFFYPELLPDNYKTVKKGTTNLETFVHIADSLGVNQIDFNAWFLDLKNKTTENIYTKQGIHWSMFGAVLAADSVIKYVERIRGIVMPHIALGKIEHTTVAQHTDNDLSNSLNLIIPFNNELFAYPEIQYPDENKKQKPKAIYIGDSFLCQWEFSGIFEHINSKWQIWFFFNTVCTARNPFGCSNPPYIKDIDWMEEVKKTDYIVMLYTAKNLPKLGNGFIEQAYNYFYPGK